MNKYRRGDIVLIDNPIRPDSYLQGGRRPWVIVQNDKGNFYSPTTIAVPLSTKIKKSYRLTHLLIIAASIIRALRVVNRYEPLMFPTVGDISERYRPIKCTV